MTDTMTPIPDAPGPKLPFGWDLHPGPKRTFYAAHAREGFRTENHGEAEEAIAEAVQIHAREIAVGDLLEDEIAEGSFVESDDEAVPAAEDGRKSTSAPDDRLAVVIKEKSVPLAKVERRRRASFLLQQTRVATLVQAVAIARLHEEGLHEELGYDTWKEFCDVELDMSAAHVRKLRTIASRFEGLLPESWTDEKKLLAAPEPADTPENERSTSNASSLAALGVEKLYQLATLDEADVSEVVTEGVVTLPNGQTRTLDELRQQTVKAMGKDFREQKKLLKERAQVVEAERDKAIAERDALRAAHERAEETYETGKALERRWSLEQVGFEQQKKTITEAHDAFREFRRLAAKVDVSPDSDEELRRRLWQMLQDARDLVDRLHVEYQDVVAVEVGLSA